jgi:hypothetical protein
MSDDINELIDAIVKIDERLNKHELTTQRELKVWSQTNLELMSIINRQGTAIEVFGETATQMAQLWQQSTNLAGQSMPGLTELMHEQRNLLEKQQQWQTACDEGVMELTENLTKEIQGMKIALEKESHSQQMPVSAELKQELEMIKTAIAMGVAGQPIDYTKMKIPQKKNPMRGAIDNVLGFKLNGLAALVLICVAVVAGVLFKQQEVFSAFGGEDKYHIGRMLISFPKNGDKLKKCTDTKQQECQLQIKNDQLKIPKKSKKG